MEISKQLSSEAALLFFVVIVGLIGIIILLIKQNKNLGKEINEISKILSSVSNNVRLLCQAAMSGVIKRD